MSAKFKLYAMWMASVRPWHLASRWHRCTEKLLIVHVDTLGRQVPGAKKLGHCDLRPLTYRQKFTFPMLTQWGTEMVVLQRVKTGKHVLWCQNITHDKAFLPIPNIWPWPHSQGHRRHLKFKFEEWHVLTSVHPDTSYHACRYLRSVSPWSHNIRSLWPLTSDLRCMGPNSYTFKC